MNTPILEKSFNAAGTIPAYRIVKHDGTDGDVVVATDATDKMFGVSGLLDKVADETVDVVVVGVTLIEYGGNVTRDDLLTCDAEGKAVTASPAAGENNRVVGIAMESGIESQIGSILLAQGSLQG